MKLNYKRAWRIQPISTDPLTGFNRVFVVKEQSNNDDSIFAHGLVCSLDNNGDVIDNARIKPYELRLSCEWNKPPYVLQQNGNYTETEPIYDEDEESETFGDSLNGVVTRYEYLKYIYYNVSNVSGDMLSLFIQNADIAGEFDK